MEEKLDALVAYGDTKITGNVRYLSGYSSRFGGYESISGSEWVTFGKAVVVVPLETEPTLITDCAFAEKAVREVSVLDNIEFSMDFKCVADLLKKPQNARVGISTWDRLPHSMYMTIKERLPDASLVPSFIVEDERMVKSAAEVEILRKAAQVADEGVCSARSKLWLRESPKRKSIWQPRTRWSSGIPPQDSSSPRTYLRLGPERRLAGPIHQEPN